MAYVTPKKDDWPPELRALRTREDFAALSVIHLDAEYSRSGWQGSRHELEEEDGGTSQMDRLRRGAPIDVGCSENCFPLAHDEQRCLRLLRA